MRHVSQKLAWVCVHACMQVGDFAMLPAKDTRELLYRMLKAGFMFMQVRTHVLYCLARTAWTLYCLDGAPPSHELHARFAPDEAILCLVLIHLPYTVLPLLPFPFSAGHPQDQ